MTYGELKAQFVAVLNRTDITTALTTTFIDQGVKRAQRKLRIPPQEVSLDYVASAFVNLPVPSDLIQAINLSVNNQYVQFMPLSQFLEINDYSTGQPIYWTRKGAAILMKPVPTDGATISFLYYGQFTPFTADSQTTTISLIAPDLIIYAALKYAADYYIDERAATFDATFAEIAQDLQDQAYSTDGVGQMQPAYILDQD